MSIEIYRKFYLQSPVQNQPGRVALGEPNRFMPRLPSERLKVQSLVSTSEFCQTKFQMIYLIITCLPYGGSYTTHNSTPTEG